MSNTTTASSRQTFALFCATGKDWRNDNLTVEQASQILGAVQEFRGNKPAALECANKILRGESVTTPKKPQDVKKAFPCFSVIFNEADNAGKAAAKACKPIPMVVSGYAPIIGGVCGFAWVHFKDGRKPFTRWMKYKGHANNSSRGGMSYYAPFKVCGQSLTMQEHYCSAFAQVCQSYGVECSMRSQID